MSPCKQERMMMEHMFKVSYEEEFRMSIVNINTYEVSSNNAHVQIRLAQMTCSMMPTKECKNIMTTKNHKTSLNMKLMKKMA